MLKYFFRRILILLPTLLGVTVVVFAIINMAPGGPIDQKLQEIRFGGGMGGAAEGLSTSSRGSTQGVPEEVLCTDRKIREP